MALVFMTGFEWGTNRELDSAVGNISTTYKRSGAYSISLGNDGWSQKVLPQPLTEFYIQFAYMTQYPSNPDTFFVVSKGSTDLVSFKKDTNGRITVCSGYGGAVYLTGQTILQAWVWYVLELHFKLADSGGVIELRIDGNLEGTFLGDTKPGADADFDKVRWGATTGTNSFYLDDVVIFDTTGAVNNSWPNGLKLVLLKPNGDGTYTQWTPAPGPAHYSGVDEVPASGTDYVKANNVDLLESFGIEDLPAEAQAVKAVRLDMWGFKASIQPPQQVQTGIRLGGSDYLSGDKGMPLAQGLVPHYLDQNPAGGNWSVSAVNSMELLLKSRT
jgi:hypothetical protein